MPQRADAAQHGRDQLAHQRAVAGGEPRQPRMLLGAVQLGIERAMAAQYVVEDVGGDAARREAGNLCGRYTPGRCHWAQGWRVPTLQARSRVRKRAESFLAL